MFIDGQFVDAVDSRSIPILNPATEDVLAEAPAGGSGQVEQAVAARAFRGWSRTPASERAHRLHQLATDIRRHREALARLLAQEDEFLQIKHVHWDIVGRRKDTWYPYGSESRAG